MIISAPSCDLVIVGLTGSGKSTLAKRLGRLTGAPIIEVGQVVMRDAVGCRKCTSPPEHADHLIKSADYLRFVQNVVKAVSNYGIPSIIVGPRHPFEVEFLGRALKAPLIVGLDLPDSMRRARYELPSDVRNIVKDEVEFYRRDALERSWGVRYSLYMSQVLLDATLHPEELQAVALGAWWHFSLHGVRQLFGLDEPASELVVPDETVVCKPDSFRLLVVAAAELYRGERRRGRLIDSLEPKPQLYRNVR